MHYNAFKNYNNRHYCDMYYLGQDWIFFMLERRTDSESNYFVEYLAVHCMNLNMADNISVRCMFHGIIKLLSNPCPRSF